MIVLLDHVLKLTVFVVDFAADARAKASQVSTYNNYYASKAISGSCFSLYYTYGGFTHTEDEWYPWWQVDLGTFLDVRNVRVVGRCK